MNHLRYLGNSQLFRLRAVGGTRLYPALFGRNLLNQPNASTESLARVPKQAVEGASIGEPALPLRAPMPIRSSMRRRMNASKDTEAKRVNTAVAVCTAQAYHFRKLCSFLRETFGNTRLVQEDVMHVILSHESSSEADAFFFEDGCFAVWCPPHEVSGHLLRLKDMLRPYELEPLSESETETLSYKERMSDHFYAGMEGETVILEFSSQEPAVSVTQAKLAFTNGLVDSVKLAVLEKSLDHFTERVKPIPMTLAKGGKLPWGRAEVLCLTGELLKFRADLNLHSELTETPEIYWSEPRLEELYNRSARVLDIRQRAYVLNKRLDYANELVSVLRTHLSEVHGLKLEWGIIILIAVEVAFATLHWLR